MHLTDLSIRGLIVDHGQRDIADDALPGLCLRVGKRTKTFMLVVGGKGNRRRIKLGAYPYLSLSQARSKAKELIGEHQKPLKERQAAVSVQQAFDRFEELHLRTKNRPSTAESTRRRITKHLLPTLGKRRIGDVAKDDVAEIIDGLVETPSECHHLYTAAKTFFRFCERRGYLDTSPLASMEPPTRPSSRERFLSLPEVGILWKTAEASGTYGVILKVLLLSGQRLGQIAGLRAEHIDYDKKIMVWPGSLMKSGRPHAIPFGDLTAALLEKLPDEGVLLRSETGAPFNNWSDAHRTFLKASKLRHFTRHDLRRTFSTLHASIGTPQHLVELLLAHRTGQISGVSAIYNRYNYMDEMRKAAEA